MTIHLDQSTLIFGGHEITYQSWYGVDAEDVLVANNRTYNPAGEMYDNNRESIEAYYAQPGRRLHPRSLSVSLG